MAADYLVLSRHGVFYFRRCVPTALRATLGRRQITLSLHTTNKREARIRVRSCAAASDTFFTRILAMTKKKKGKDEVFTTYLTMKAGFDDNGNAYFSVDAEPHETDAAQPLIAAAGDALAAVKAATPGAPPPTSTTQHAATKALLARPTLAEAIAAFEAGHQVKPTTARRYAPALARLQAFLGAATPLASITQSRFAEYAADVNAEEGPAPKTKGMCITTGGTFFKWCTSRYDDAPAITTDKLKIKRQTPERDERGAFTLNELQAILDAASTLRAKEPHKFWITALLTFTGMRVEELCQLDPHADLKLDAESGYWYFEIHGRGDNSVKTLAGWRQVPLHPALITAGFLDYVATLKSSGETKLFPQWRPRVDPEHGGARYGHEAIKWSGHQLAKLRKAGAVTTPKATYFHSMRHALVNNLKQAGVDESIRAALVGHEVGGINQNRYGKGYNLKLLGDALVEKLPSYRGLLSAAKT